MPADSPDLRSDTWDSLTPTVCLAIPGLWTDREQLQRQLVRETGRQFTLLGGSVVRSADLKEFPCDTIEHDPLLAGAIQAASRGRIAGEQLEAIARHTLTVYVRGEGGSTPAAREMMDLATAIVHAGGLAVKVESSGNAIARDEWINYADPAQPAGLYWAFVALIREAEQGGFSCGMHTFGLRDAITTWEMEVEPLAALVHNFLGLTFQTRPPINDGDEFSDDESGVVYRVRAEPCANFPPGHMQHNPYGMWRLEPPQ